MFAKSETVETPKSTAKQNESIKQSPEVKHNHHTEKISQISQFFEAGEYKEPTSMFLSQKVGDLYHRSKGATFEQIL